MIRDDVGTAAVPVPAAGPPRLAPGHDGAAAGAARGTVPRAGPGPSSGYGPGNFLVLDMFSC